MLTKLTLLERIVLPNCEVNSQKPQQNVKKCNIAGIIQLIFNTDIGNDARLVKHESNLKAR